jgi:hypothetical protein
MARQRLRTLMQSDQAIAIAFDLSLYDTLLSTRNGAERSMEAISQINE